MSSAPSSAGTHFELWLQASSAQAAALLADQVILKDAMNALRFYFVRKAIALNEGKISRTAASLGAHRDTLCRSMRFRNGHMAPAARMLAENWATWLASQGATLREAEGIFAKALTRAAREICDGNQCEAARLLGIHRNSVRRITALTVEQQPERRA